MAVGLGRLRLAPEAFWAMTPKELAAAMGAFATQASARPPSRADLVALMAAFPDR